jgi:hypothetical protein
MRRAIPNEEAMKMTAQERLDLGHRLGEEFLAEFRAANGLSREEALAKIRDQKQAVRPRPSRSKGA